MWADVFCNLNEPIKEVSEKEGRCLAVFSRVLEGGYQGLAREHTEVVLDS